MLSTVCLVTASLLFLLFHPYKSSSWLNIWDSIAFSLCAVVVFCLMYSKYIAPVPIQITEVLSVVPLVYLVIYVIYRLVVWVKTLQICKKRYKDPLIPESEEPDRLTHPEDYINEEEVKLLLPDDQDPNLDTYPVCGNSQQKYGSVQR